MKLAVVVLLLAASAQAHVPIRPMYPMQDMFANRLVTMPIGEVITVYRFDENEWYTWDHVPRCMYTDKPGPPPNSKVHLR